MRKILLILSLFTTLFATAQSGSWTNISGNQRFSKGLGIPVKDTFAITRPEDSAQVVIRPQDGYMYYVYKGAWKKSLAIDTTSLSNRINLKLNISDTAAMLSGYQRIGTLSSSYIHNQNGSTLSSQTAKFYVTDTIKTDGKVIASGVSGLSASSSVGITGINSSTGRAMSATSLSGEAIRASNNSTTSPTISINQFGSANIVELLNGYGFGVKIDTSGSIIMSNSKSSAYTGKISIPFLNANRTYTLPDASGTLALTSDIPVSGTFTNRRIPFSNSSGQLKDTTGFTWGNGSLNVPGDYYTPTGDFITNAAGKGFYGALFNIYDNSSGILGIIENSSSNGSGLTVAAGSGIYKYALRLAGYNGDSIANFNPLGAYFYKPINADSANFTNALNVGLSSGTGSVIVRKTTGAQAAFYGSSDLANNRDGSGKILLGSNGSYQGVLQYYDGGSTILYLDNTFDNASAQIKLRLRTNGTPVDALTLAGTGTATFSSTIQTAAPSGGTAQPWKLGNAVSGTLTPNYYLLVEVNGQVYSIPCLLGTP